jgi:hypothetical protein
MQEKIVLRHPDCGEHIAVVEVPLAVDGEDLA